MSRLRYLLAKLLLNRSAATTASLLSLIVVLLISFTGTPIAQAFSTINQTDWSGGVGSDPDTQYTNGISIDDSTPGQISVDNSGETSVNWCNTANCDNNWTRRQVIHINNYSHDEQTDYILEVDIPHQSAMKSDFSDLRFANSVGDTDLSYFQFSSTDLSAHFYIKVPTVDAYSVTDIYAYYGNSGASSLSDKHGVFPIADEFADDTACGTDVCANNVSLSGGVATRTGTGAVAFTPPSGRAHDRIEQIDIMNDLSSYGCTEDVSGLGGLNLSTPFDTAHLNINKSTSCLSGIKYWGVTSILTGAGGFNDTGDPYQMIVPSGAWATLRVTILSSGGEKVEYSLDGGVTFSELNFYSHGNDTSDAWFQFGNGNATATHQSFRNVVSFERDVDLTGYLGIEEYEGGRTGMLLSNRYNLGSTHTSFGAVLASYTGTGHVGVYVTSSNNASLDSDPRLCGPIAPGDDLTDSGCVHNGTQYIQYAVVLSSDSSDSLALTNISLEYNIDDTPPTNASNLTIKRSSSGDTIAENAWANVAPYYSWTAGADEGDGSGLAGYCIYVGTSSGGDPASSAGVITDSSPVDTDGACTYATTDTHLDLNAIGHSTLSSGSTYYLNIKAIDNTGNITSTVSTNFRFDNTPPYIGTLMSGPNTVVNSKIFSVNWLSTGLASFTDGESGPAGLKYCVTNILIGLSGCSSPSDTNWYGAAHTSGLITDMSDLIPFSASTFSTVPADASRLDDSVALYNRITVIGVDYAGNGAAAMADFGLVINKTPPSAPANLAANPPSSSTNAFSFTWDAPEAFAGQADNLDYCWTVNVTIAEDASNCNWTGAGITELATGPYATQQGTNTLYLAAKDEAGNFSRDNAASVTFSASTAAPGTAQNLDISDVSIRATNTWKLALSWNEPQTGAEHVSSYRILRSTDASSYSEVGSTSNSNLSFIDSGLSQVTYYYKIRACDNADSCGVASNAVSRKPTGRFTSPARLTSDTDQPKTRDIGTRKATAYWFTDRESDSKIAIGTSPGVYSDDEIGNSAQTTDHSIALTNLQAGTTYYYVAKWTDQDGNVGQSGERSFTTLPAPNVSEVTASGVTISTATINLTTTSASKIELQYGINENFGGSQSLNTSTDTSTYHLSLDGLNDGVKYLYRINTYDTDGNKYLGSVHDFTTLAIPKITSLAVTPVDNAPNSTQKVTWTTNVPTTSELTYGAVGGKSKDALDSKLKTSHELIITGLEDDSNYTLVARSHDEQGNLATSETKTFHTAFDTRAPVISDVTTETAIRGNGGEARAQIIVSWHTDEPATSQVGFGQGDAGQASNHTAEDTRLTLEHIVVVSDIPTSSIYHVQAISNDKARNQATSDNQTAIIGRPSENVFSIIYTALQKIFGVR